MSFAANVCVHACLRAFPRHRKVLNVSVPADSVPGQKITAVASSGDEVSAVTSLGLLRIDFSTDDDSSVHLLYLACMNTTVRLLHK